MKLCIIDTKACNLNSVYQACKKLDCEILVSSDPNNIKNADKFILPGVGTATAVMDGIFKFDLKDLIINTKKPLLGICLGMQVLTNKSYEVPLNSNIESIECLGIIDACVKKFEVSNLSLPHMGWNQINIEKDNALFKDIKNNSFFYFVHSYCVGICQNTIASCEYGMKFSAALHKDNFFGVQFHPEKSGSVGLKLLDNFIKL